MSTIDNKKASKILLVEDEESLAVGLEYNLSRQGYIVTRAENGRQAIELFDENHYNLIILDIMLPFVDGFQVASHIREQNARIPILMLTARSTAKDRIEGLETGADDYMAKPFHLDELLLRVKGMLKRSDWYTNMEEDTVFYRFGENEVNFQDLSCKSGKKEFRLTPQEALMLKYLIDNKGRIVSRKELLENVWHIESEDIETRTVDNFIVRLRKYFEPFPVRPVYIKSIRGAGYLFNDDPVNQQKET